MRRFLPFLFLLCALGLTQQGFAQSVTTNFIPTRPGDYTVPSGSIVSVKNTSSSDVTIDIPYELPITLSPGESHAFVVKPNPGGSSHVEGPAGAWRFTASNAVGGQRK